MAKAEALGHADTKSKLLAILRKVPPGRVVTYDILASSLSILPRHVETLLGHLSQDERETVPWHRAVAKGGAIGWSPLRDDKFHRLIREGVAVSPAGIVQDLARTAVKDLTGVPSAPKCAAPLSRSRGKKDRPG